MNTLMKTIVVVVVLALLLIAGHSGVQCKSQTWAVLVAGSNQYYNYRHQADICHAYQMLHKQGVPESNIIVMMYDDIAHNSLNPKKGSIINCYGCPNVYPGVPKDYTGSTVTAENFLKILRGEDMTGIGSGKTLKSGPKDEVFVFYSDHGGPGIVAMPVGPFLYAKDLISTLHHMKKNRKFKNLVFYLEACESGSMFNNLLPNDWNIFATTASTPFQSSYACDYDSTYRAYLNDCWSRNFMNDTVSHASILNEYTLGQQFKNVKKMTKESQACQYGDDKMEELPVGNFLAGGGRAAYSDHSRIKTDQNRRDHVLARDVKTHWLRKQISLNQDEIERSVWLTRLKEHEHLKSTLEIVWESFAQKLNLDSLDRILTTTNDNDDDDNCYHRITVDVHCIKDAVEAAERACGPFVEESLVYTHYLNNACLRGVSPKVMERSLKEICSIVHIPEFTTRF